MDRDRSCREGRRLPSRAQPPPPRRPPRRPTTQSATPRPTDRWVPSESFTTNLLPLRCCPPPRPATPASPPPAAARLPWAWRWRREGRWEGEDRQEANRHAWNWLPRYQRTSMRLLLEREVQSDPMPGRWWQRPPPVSPHPRQGSVHHRHRPYHLRPCQLALALALAHKPSTPQPAGHQDQIQSRAGQGKPCSASATWARRGARRARRRGARGSRRGPAPAGQVAGQADQVGQGEAGDTIPGWQGTSQGRSGGPLVYTPEELVEWGLRSRSTARRQAQGASEEGYTEHSG